jgi:hypothetical protein
MYAVKCETHEGKVMTMRRGFATRDAAQDHPVTLSKWKRVWVEKEQPPTAPPPPCLPPFPWSLEFAPVYRGTHIYLLDANRRKIAVFFGRDGEKKLIADYILQTANTMWRKQNANGGVDAVQRSATENAAVSR